MGSCASQPDAAARGEESAEVPALLRTHAEAIAQLRALVEPLHGYDAASHDGLCLLRFLLSHKLQPKAAARAFEGALAWRRANGIDAIAAAIRAGKAHADAPHYAAVAPHLPMHLLLDGAQPICFVQAHELRLPELMRSVSSAEYVAYTHFANELSFQAVDRATRSSGRLVRLVRLIDAKGLGWRHVSLRYLAAVAAAARGGEDAYPQLLGAFYLCNLGPSMASLWERTIRPLLPARMVEKAHVLEPGSRPRDREALLAALSPERVPTQLGGRLEVGSC